MEFKQQTWETKSSPVLQIPPGPRSSSQATKSKFLFGSGPPTPSCLKEPLRRFATNTQKGKNSWKSEERGDHSQLVDRMSTPSQENQLHVGQTHAGEKNNRILVVVTLDINEQLVPEIKCPTARRKRAESHFQRDAPRSLQRFTFILGAVLLLDFAVFCVHSKNHAAGTENYFRSRFSQ